MQSRGNDDIDELPPITPRGEVRIKENSSKYLENVKTKLRQL